MKWKHLNAFLCFLGISAVILAMVGLDIGFSNIKNNPESGFLYIGEKKSIRESVESDSNVEETANDVSENAEEETDDSEELTEIEETNDSEAISDNEVKLEAVQPQEDKIHYLSVGGSDAILIESNGQYALVDSSNALSRSTSNTAALKYAEEVGQETNWSVTNEKYSVSHVIRYLEKVMNCSTDAGTCKGKLNFIVATHSHSDHIGGMVQIAKHFVNNNTTYYYNAYVLENQDRTNNGYNNEDYYNKAVAAMNAASANMVNLGQDGNVYTFDIGDFNVKILNNTPANADESISVNGKLYAIGENKNSLIELVTYKNTGTKVLLASDLEKEDEKRLIKDSTTKELLSNIALLKMGHHGLSSSSTIDFIKAIESKNGTKGTDIIISTSSYNAKGTNTLSLRYASKNYNSKIYITSGVDDAIVQTFADNGSYTLTNSNSTGNLNNAKLNVNDVQTSGKLHKIEYNGTAYWFRFDSETSIGTTGWLYDDNTKKWNYFYPTGYRVTGWDNLKWKDEESRYYFDSNGAMQTGWLKYDNKWYYLASSGAMQTGWLTYDGKKYYLDKNGVMQTGFVTVNNKIYYFESSGALKSSGWFKVNNIWYYVNSDGTLKTGWLKDDNVWYYLNSKGAMQTGWITYNDKKYYLASSGAMQTGWITYNNKEYYLDSSGAMQTGWLTYNGKRYYLGNDGIMHTGWLTYNSKKYYLESSGAMKTGWLRYDNKWYYFNSDGIMQIGWITDGGKRYFLDTNGIMQTGWLTYNDHEYYLDSSGALQFGWISHNNKKYYVENTGKLKTGWLNYSSKWYYFDNSGLMKTGWITDSNKKYYLESSGAMQTGWLKYDNKWYYLESSGVMQTGWLSYNSKKYHFDNTGIMETGWLTYNDKKYYLESSGAMKTGWLKYNDKWYYLDSSGAMKTGWVKDGGKWYYLGADGIMYSNTCATISNVKYCFNSSGACTSGNGC